MRRPGEKRSGHRGSTSTQPGRRVSGVYRPDARRTICWCWMLQRRCRIRRHISNEEFFVYLTDNTNYKWKLLRRCSKNYDARDLSLNASSRRHASQTSEDDALFLLSFRGSGTVILVERFPHGSGATDITGTVTVTGCSRMRIAGFRNVDFVRSYDPHELQRISDVRS